MRELRRKICEAPDQPAQVLQPHMPTARQRPQTNAPAPMSAAERKRRYRARLRDGLVRLEIETNRLWLAEVLAAG